MFNSVEEVIFSELQLDHLYSEMDNLEREFENDRKKLDDNPDASWIDYSKLEEKYNNMIKETLTKMTKEIFKEEE